MSSSNSNTGKVLNVLEVLIPLVVPMVIGIVDIIYKSNERVIEEKPKPIRPKKEYVTVQVSDGYSVKRANSKNSKNYKGNTEVVYLPDGRVKSIREFRHNGASNKIGISTLVFDSVKEYEEFKKAKRLKYERQEQRRRTQHS